MENGDKQEKVPGAGGRRPPGCLAPFLLLFYYAENRIRTFHKRRLSPFRELVYKSDFVYYDEK